MKNRSLSIIVSTFILASCGGGGEGGGSTLTPTVNLSAEPTSVLLGNTSTLTWSSTNATSCSASWTTQTGSSGSEAVTISTAGNNSFSITCTGAGGSRSATVTVEGYRNTDGVVVDGYISGAEVCIDEDESWTCDTNESSTTSDNDGKFTIKYANGNLVSIGGTDLDSQTLLDNFLITHKLTGHSDFKAVTPVTSIAAFMTDASLINSALGIDASIDVFTFDPVAEKGDGGISDYLYEKGNQLTVLAYALQNITNNLNTITETTQDYFKAITEEIEKEYTETTTKVDIETEEFITKTLDNIVTEKTLTITDEAKANTAKALSGVMPVIEVKTSNDLTTSVIRFAVSTLQTDIQAIANGAATAETIASYTSDVLTYIAEDQNIEADEIAPDISAIADSATTSEDTSVTINVVVNDSYLTSAPISVSAGNASNGTTTLAESSPEQIVYTPNTDYNGTDTFSYTITQGDKTSSADVSITVEAVNDAPTIDTASTIQVPENQTAVTTISVSDVDEDDLTLTLSGTDADSFDLSTDNVLTFKEAPDFETKSSYSINLSLTDGTETLTKDISVTVTNVNDIAPEFTSEATFSAAENQTAIGTITATDAEGDEITFTVSGTELAITSAGVLTFVSAPDFETKASYTAIVTATDGANPATQDITVTVTNVNDIAPEFTSEATFSAAENQTAIGTITATDAEGDEITFTASGSELAITSAGILTFVSAANYETKTTYTAIVTASDGTNSTTQDITVNVSNINDEEPYFNETSYSFVASENNTQIGAIWTSDSYGGNNITVIGTAKVLAFDGDEGLNEITYTITGDELQISANGEINFVEGFIPDFENKNVFNETITADDSSFNANADIQVRIFNESEVQKIVGVAGPNVGSSSFNSNSATFNIYENSSEALGVKFERFDNNEYVGISCVASGTDSNLLTTPACSVSETFSQSSFGILSTPDYEQKNTYRFKITTNSTTFYDVEGGLNKEFDVIINILDVNEAPEFTSEATFNAEENQTAIGTVIATDAESDDVTFTVSGDELAITSAGVLTFASAPDYETKTIYTATVTAIDGMNTTTQDITVNVTNVNDNSPVFTSSATFSAAENQTAIDTVTATDTDGDSVTFTVSGSELEITSAGVLTFASAPDYETKAVYSATITASDGVNSTTQEATININNIDEGIIYWDYDISDGTDNSPPILNSIIQFDASMDIDDAIVTLRQDVYSGQFAFTKIQHTKTNTNKWVGTFLLPENANPNLSYYGTIFYKEGDNSTNFNGLSSAAITGYSKWTEIITSYDALKLGLIDETISFPSGREYYSNPKILKIFNNESFDNEAPAVQGYIDNEGNLISSPEDALIISGNDGDVATPINISLTVQYDEDIIYAMAWMSLRTDGGVYTAYPDAVTTINGNKVTVNVSLNSKTPIDGSRDLLLYIYGYDSGLNRTRARTGSMDLESNSIGDANVPILSSINFSGSLRNDGRKLIDYQYVFSAEDNDLIEIGQTLKGPYCNFVYFRSHDYNIDATLASGTYSGSKLLAKNMPDGIYITARNLTVHDSQYNKLQINRSDISSYSLAPIIFGESSDYCPDFKEDSYRTVIEIPENTLTSSVVTTFRDEIKDPYGNFVSPEFSLGGLDGHLFNISNEGDITFKAAPDYENIQTDYIHEVDVRVHSTAVPISENPNLYVSEAIKIEVTNVQEWPSSAQVDFVDDTYIYQYWVDTIPVNFDVAKRMAILEDIPYTKVIISGQDADYFNFQNGTKEGTETNDLNFYIYRSNKSYECGRSFNFRITITDGTNSAYDDVIIPLTCS